MNHMLMHAVLVNAEAPLNDAKHAQENTRLERWWLEVQLAQTKEAVDVLHQGGLVRGENQRLVARADS